MKINTVILIFVVIACVLIAAYDVKSFASKPAENASVSQMNISTPASATGSGQVLPNANQGQLFISIGKFDASLPVFIDNKTAGTVTDGKPLSMVLSSGNHTVVLCAGTICNSIDIKIKPGIKITLDFEDLLNQNLNQGSINVSIGKYNAQLPVFVDESGVGNVSSDKPLNLVVSTGQHIVKTCVRNDYCFSEDVKVEPLNLTTVDFGDQLTNNVMISDLIISIGGYNAIVPIAVDNVSVGNATQGHPVSIKVFEGQHRVQVCSGVVCKSRSVSTQFGKPAIVDFGEELIRDAEFTAPTARIIDSYMNGNMNVVTIEFINPDKKDHDFAATVTNQYTYIDYTTRTRNSDSATGQLTATVKSGARLKRSVSLYMPGGASSSLMPSSPIISEITIT